MSDELLLKLSRQARDGDRVAFGELIELFRPRLKQMIELRLDRRLRQRLDASDVLQEVYLRGAGANVECTTSFEAVSPYVWLRQITMWKLLDIHRKHFGAQRRDPRLEHASPKIDNTLSMADWLVDSITSPSDIVAREERLRLLNEALESLEPIDREILVLRHCEQMTRNEAAETLGITVQAAAKRYFRAIQRVRLAMIGSSDSHASA